MIAFLSFLILPESAKAQDKKKKYTTLEVSIDIEAPVKDAFEYMDPVDLAHIFKQGAKALQDLIDKEIVNDKVLSLYPLDKLAPFGLTF